MHCSELQLSDLDSSIKRSGEQMTGGHLHTGPAISSTSLHMSASCAGAGVHEEIASEDKSYGDDAKKPQ